MTKSVALQIAPAFFTFLSFTAMYKVLPHKKVRLELAAIGGVVAAALWEGAKYAFAWYVGDVADISGIYGSLTAIIVFLLWIFYTAVILLLVAEMVNILDKDRIGLN